MKETLRNLFQKKFNRDEYSRVVLQNLLHAQQLLREPQLLEETNEGDRIYGLGYLHDTNGKEIGLYYTEVVNGDVRRKRVGFRQMMKPYVKYGADAAIAVFADKEHWRLSYMCDLKGGETSAKRFSYVFGDPKGQYNTPSNRLSELREKKIVLDDLNKTFSVEALSKEFFNGYHKHYDIIVGELKRQGKSGAVYHDYVKKMMGRIVFLYFLQKKRWLNNNPAFLSELFFFSPLDRQTDFLEKVLEPLFFGIFNTEKNNREQLFKNEKWDLTLLKDWKELPYLNGGLFERDEIDKKNIKLPASIFENLFNFLASYNFTVDENDPDDAEIGVDPEMLGKIFESLLEDNKEKGAFYTPKEIVRYMCRESLIAYLVDEAKKKSNKNDEDFEGFIRKFVNHPYEVAALIKDKNATKQLEDIDASLRDVKICDPAIGSGAFPMGLLNELVACREAINTVLERDISRIELKKHIIQNNIYGVDIEKGAVDIARLRFWLALVVDETEPQPLPNLDYKIMCGDSLFHRFALDTPFQNVFKHYNRENKTNITLDNYRQWVHEYTNISDHTQKDKFRQKIEDIKNAFKTGLSQKEINKLSNTRGAIVNLQAKDLFGNQVGSDAEIKKMKEKLKDLEHRRDDIVNNKIYENAFEWRFEFPALLDKEGNFTGFDIVIGNPPYVQLQNDNGKLGKIYQTCSYKTFASTGDLYCLFYERGHQLLKQGGHLCYITSNKWMRAGYGEKTREFFATQTNPILLIDFAGLKIFESATVDTNILLFAKDTNKHQTISVVSNKQNKDSVKNLSDFVKSNHSLCDFSSCNNWVILSPIEQSIKHKIESIGTPLKDWDINIYRGVLTGCNEAFIIDSAKRNEILANCKTEDERQRTTELIRPILRGRDIKRNGYDWDELWLINTHNGVKGKYPPIDINDYPSVKQHLDCHWDRISTRDDKGITPYNLRNCAYLDDFNKPKIVYSETNNAFETKICIDTDFHLADKTCFILVCENERILKHVYKWMSSKVFSYYMRIKSPLLGSQGISLTKETVEKFPLCPESMDYEFTSQECDEIEKY